MKNTAPPEQYLIRHNRNYEIITDLEETLIRWRDSIYWNKPERVTANRELLDLYRLRKLSLKKIDRAKVCLLLAQFDEIQPDGTQWYLEEYAVKAIKLARRALKESHVSGVSSAALAFYKIEWDARRYLQKSSGAREISHERALEQGGDDSEEGDLDDPVERFVVHDDGWMDDTDDEHSIADHEKRTILPDYVKKDKLVSRPLSDRMTKKEKNKGSKRVVIPLDGDEGNIPATNGQAEEAEDDDVDMGEQDSHHEDNVEAEESDSGSDGESVVCFDKAFEDVIWYKGVAWRREIAHEDDGEIAEYEAEEPDDSERGYEEDDDSDFEYEDPDQWNDENDPEGGFRECNNPKYTVLTAEEFAPYPSQLPNTPFVYRPATLKRSVEAAALGDAGQSPAKKRVQTLPSDIDQSPANKPVRSILVNTHDDAHRSPTRANKHVHFLEDSQRQIEDL